MAGNPIRINNYDYRIFFEKITRQGEEQMKPNTSNSEPRRKHKDLKVVQSHVYESCGGDALHIQIMDRITGKIYAGNIHKTFDKFKDWKNRYGDKK